MKTHSAFLALALGAATLGAVGCGSASANGKASAKTDEKDPFAVHGSSAWDMSSDSEGDVPDQPAKKKSADGKPATAGKTAPAAAAAPAGGEVALLGARHDVYVGQGAPTPCKCLAVVVGPASAAGILWSGQRPTLDAASQLVIALGSEDVSCDRPSTGASYQGYEREGDNVLIRVEAAAAGRPITHGAIIPKPPAGGQIQILAQGSAPYGRGPNGEARCVVTPSR